MYERMLNKQQTPIYDDFVHYLGNAQSLFEQLDTYLTENLAAEKMLRFPYGSKYGWGMKYFIKSKHICDVFAEKDAFTVMLRLSDKQFLALYNSMSTYTKQFIDNKYPCGEGGWIHYRVLNSENLQDIMTMLQFKGNHT